MKSANTNPMKPSPGNEKPDAGVLRMMKAKVKANSNNETSNSNYAPQAKLNRPNAKSAATQPKGPAQPPKTAAAKLNRKPRTS